MMTEKKWISVESQGKVNSTFSVIFKLLVALVLTTSFSAVNSQNAVTTKALSLLSEYQYSHAQPQWVTSIKEYVFFWTPQSDGSVNLALLARSRGWVGFGLCPTGAGGMVGNTAVIGVGLNSASPQVVSYYLTDYIAGNMSPLNTAGISNSSVETVDPTYILVRFNYKGACFNIDTTTDYIMSYNPTTPTFTAKHFASIRMSLSLKTGSGAVPFIPYCTDCGHGVCDGLYCTCTDNSYSGDHCNISNNNNNPTTTPSPSPTPTPTPSGPQRFDPVANGYTGSIPLIPDILTAYYKPVTASSSTLEIALQGIGVTGWVGIGWSKDGGMVGSQAVIGWVSSTSNKTALYNLAAQVPSAVTEISNSGVISIYQEEFQGTTTVVFSRPFTAATNFNPTGENIMIGAYGVVDKIDYHSGNNRGTTVNFLSGSVSQNMGTFSGFTVHGIIMWISWGILLPFGVVFARYGKAYDDNLWFKVHRPVQIVGSVLSLIGLFLAIGLVGSGTHFHTVFHGQLGLTIEIIVILHIIYAFLRPHPEPKNLKRKIFEYFHWWTGRILLLLSAINIYAGIVELNYSTLLSGIMIVIVTIVYVVFILISIIREIKNRKQKQEGF